MASAGENMNPATEGSSETDLDFKELGIISHQAYETQFFGFTPKSFTDGLYNAVVEYVYDGLVSASKALNAEFKHNSRPEQELLEAVEKLYQELLPTIGRAFDKLENVFGVPEGVLLQEDRIWSEYPSVNHATVKQLEEQIQTLEKKVKAAMYVRTCLRQELADTEPLVARLRRVTSDQSSLLNKCQAVFDARVSLDELVDQQRELDDATSKEMNIVEER